MRQPGFFSFKWQELQELFDDWGNFEALSKLGGVPAIVKGLHVDIKKGIIDDPRDRAEAFGPNTYPERKHTGFFMLMWEALQDVTLIILCVAAVISLVLGVAFPNEEEGETRATGWIEGASILAAVFLVSSVTAGNDFLKDRQFRALEKEKDNDTVLVVRDGKIVQLKVFDIVVGDIIVLERGSRIPADGLWVSGKELQVDQSNLNGESKTVARNAQHPFLLSGCTIADGEAHMIVCAVGVNCQWGLILTALEPEDDETPLQQDLGDLATKIGWLGLICAIAIFICLTIWWVVKRFIQGDPDDFQWTMLEDFIGYFIVAVTILVVAVPEGLPLAVTISLAYSMRKMMKDNNLVRHLKACETMGGVTNICTDKTGTLTENRMAVVRGWIGGNEFDGVPKVSNDALRHLLTHGISINSKAVVRPAPHGSGFEYLGNKTECALLVLVHKLDEDFNQIREQYPLAYQAPFSSERKRMTSVVGGDGAYRVYTKGASEIILERCTSVVTDSGDIIDIEDDMRQELAQALETFSNEALRTLVLAYRDLPSDWSPDSMTVGDKEENENALEQELTLIAIVGIEDPLRPAVKDAVRSCQNAGVTVRMVTGDLLNTAKSIARQCNILTKDGTAMEGKVFRNLSDQEAYAILPKLQVLARSSPQDKKLLVKRLKAMGEVVAVTGDGTNDAPALRMAHVGLSMGIEGTGVAKQASDIIILDDNFASIVKSVMWGRNVRENIQKFLQFQLTVNLVALVVAFVAAVSDQGTPLKAIQLLWVNLIMDTMAALALGTEAPTPALLDRPPAGRNYPLISATMWRNIIGQGSYQLVVLFGILYLGEHILENDDETVRNTFLFNSFVFCQVFNEVNARKVGKYEWNVFSGLHTNWIFIAIIAITAVVQALIVEFGGDVFKTEPLSLVNWGYSIAIGAGSLIVGAVLRLIPIPDMWCCAIKDRSMLVEDEVEEDEDNAKATSSVGPSETTRLLP